MIVAVPEAPVPVTIPVEASTVAGPAELLHDPPIVASDNCTDCPEHTEVVPVIAATALTTVTVRLAAQPVTGSV